MNDFFAQLRNGCFDPERLKAAWREVDASKRLHGQPELTAAERASIPGKLVSCPNEPDLSLDAAFHERGVL